MPKLDDEVDTQLEDASGEQEEVDQSQEDGEGHSDASSDGDSEHGQEPFLVVDDRTQYRTREEAQRAYAEAGRRISELSGWERELRDYGNLTPAEVRGYLDELIAAREELSRVQNQQREQEGQRGQKQNNASVDDPTLTADEKQALGWLQKRFPQLGVATKSEIQELLKGLTDKVGTLEGTIEQQRELQRQSMINDGRANLRQWMSTDKLQDDSDGTIQGMLEGFIRDYINQDKRRVDRFYQGGEASRSVLREGYDRAVKALGIVRGGQQISQSAQYTRNKADALRRNGTSLPRPGVTGRGAPAPASRQNANSGKRINSSGERDHIAEVHNKAWDLAQKRWGGGDE